MAITQGAQVVDRQHARNPYWYALRQDESKEGIGATVERLHPDSSKTIFHTSSVYKSLGDYSDAIILPILNHWYHSVKERTRRESRLFYSKQSL
jgi:hypothetical protein